MPNPAYLKKVYVTATDIAAVPADELLYVRSANRGGTVDSEPADYVGGTGVKDRILTLRDYNITIEGHFEPGDTVHALIKTSFEARAPIYVTILDDPSAAPLSQGFRYPLKIDSFDEDTDAESVTTFSLSGSAAGAAATAV